MTGLATTLCLASAFAASPAGKPTHLTCDSLDAAPGHRFQPTAVRLAASDAGFAARQTAYRIEVASKPAMLNSGKADVWDSGRVTSDKSFGVVYGGPELAASTRYYWRVEVWDKDGKPYPASDVSWWETGLLKENWKAQWIGYEDPEHRAVRKSGATWITNADSAKESAQQGSADTQHDFRFKFPAQRAGETRGPVRYRRRLRCGVGEREAGAGDAYHCRHGSRRPGRPTCSRTLPRTCAAVKTCWPSGSRCTERPSANGTGAPETSRTPMSACLYVEMTDGTVVVFASGKEWKAKLNAEQGW